MPYEHALAYSDVSLQPMPFVCLKRISSRAPDIYMVINRARRSALFNQVRRLLADRALLVCTLPGDMSTAGE